MIDVYKANYHDYSKKQLLRIIDELQNKIYKLEKALDKACEMLSSNVTTKVHEYDEYGEFDYEIPDKTKNEWKEEMLQDGE